MKFVPFENRNDVDQEHVMKIGSVTVFFLRECEESGIQKAARRLADAYEKSGVKTKSSHLIGLDISRIRGIMETDEYLVN